MKKTASRLLLATVPPGALAALYLLAVHPTMTAAEPRDRGANSGRPSVNVILAQRAQAANEVLLPANLQPLQEAPIFARTNGYLAKLLVDLGDKVQAGQPLAVIEG